jgi:AraC family transcriptional regulator
LQLQSGDGDSIVFPGEIRVTEPESTMHANGRGNALWVSLLGQQSAWRSALAGTTDFPISEPLLLPVRYTANRELRYRAVALARSAADGNFTVAANTIIDTIARLQEGLADSIARCPGRTFAQRRLVFARLQRVRNYISENCHFDLDDRELAKMASYSPWHFIRLFRGAFQETPHVYMLNQRLMRARRLLRTSPLAITEIAQASGFENRSVFSRLFRQRFGISASSLRQNGQ